MRILYAGCPEIAVKTLEEISEEHTIVGVLTNPDRCKGRKKHIFCTPVKQAALEKNFYVLQPSKLNAAFREEIKSLSPDILVVCAYGKIFGPKFLNLFPLGGINMHPSLLPQLRGPAPIPAAILQGLTSTGVTIQRIALKMDTGNILCQKEYNLKGNETTESLSMDLGRLGAPMMRATLKDIESGEVFERPQDETKASYCGLITKESGRIHWDMPAEHIERMVRAYIPWPHAWTIWDGKMVHFIKAAVDDEKEVQGKAGAVIGEDPQKGLKIQTGHGILTVRKLQLQNKKMMNWKDFLNGNSGILNAQLGEENGDNN